MRRALTLVACLMLPLSACGGDGDDETLTVLAAASLTETFTELAEQFEKEHPGVDVRLVLDSSAALAEKAIDRAPGDVLATADEKTMRDAATNGGTSGSPVEFATNELVLVVPADNPAGVRSLAGLDEPGVDYVTCVVAAPCGAAATGVLDVAGITREPVSEEVDVKAVLARVAQGEADAGLVYRTDAKAAGDDVVAFEVPEAAASPNTYWVAATPAAEDPELARAWVALTVGEFGDRVFADAGFGPPDLR